MSNLVRDELHNIRIHDGQRISDRLVKAGEILGCEQSRGKGIVHVDCGSRVQWRVSIRVVVAGVGQDERAGAIPLKGMPGVESILSNGGERPVDEAIVERTTTTLILRENKDVHHENDTIFVAEHVIGVVLFLGGELDISGVRLEIDDDDFIARARVVQSQRGVFVYTGATVAIWEPDRPKTEVKVNVLHAHMGSSTIEPEPATPHSVDTTTSVTSSPAPWEPRIREGETRATAS